MERKKEKWILTVLIVVFLITVGAICYEVALALDDLTFDDVFGHAALAIFWCFLVIPLLVSELSLIMDTIYFLSYARWEKKAMFARKATTVWAGIIVALAVIQHLSWMYKQVIMVIYLYAASILSVLLTLIWLGRGLRWVARKVKRI